MSKEQKSESPNRCSRRRLKPCVSAGIGKKGTEAGGSSDGDDDVCSLPVELDDMAMY